MGVIREVAALGVVCIASLEITRKMKKSQPAFRDCWPGGTISKSVVRGPLVVVWKDLLMESKRIPHCVSSHQFLNPMIALPLH